MAAAIPYALMAAGTASQMNAQQEQADEKRTILNRQLARNDEAAKKSSELVLSEGDNFSPEARKKAMEGQENNVFDQSMVDLKSGAGGGDPAAVNTSGDAGNVSDDFVRTKADRAVTEGTRLTGIAREIAKTRAPAMLLGQEGQRGANLASNLQTLFGSNSNMARATENDAAAVQEPGYGGLGSLASSIGSSMAAGRLAKGSAAKYSGSSSSPFAANYENSMDRGGIQW